ncbi:MAG: alpha/beta hydrolase [Promethearchaeota archaeon]|nr:MAG: alpha/beta hydrolase [Candidatus Lokiarchaeota archaeon]
MKNLRIYGKEPYRIALIHGGPGAWGEMASVAQFLSSKQGILEPLQTAKSIKEQIEELKQQILNSGEPPFILIGFSWGAWLSLLTAVYHPLIIGKIILIGCGPLEQKYSQVIIDTRLERLNESQRADYNSIMKDLTKRGNSKQTKNLIKKLKKYTNITDQYNPLSNIYENIKFNKEVYQNVWKEAAELRKNGKLLELIKTINCPVVAIHGKYDPHPAEGVKKPLSRILNDFQFFELEKCGHKPWIEKEAMVKFYNILRTQL